MKVIIGDIQLTSLKDRNIDPDEMVAFLKDLLLITRNNPEQHQTVNDLISKYVLLSKDSFVTLENESLKYYKELRDATIELINVLFNESKLDNQKKFLEAIKENFELADQKIDKKIGRKWTRLFSEPGKDS